MVWFVSMGFAIVICGVGALIGRALRKESESGSPEADRGLIVLLLAAAVFVLWVGAHTAFASLKQIEAGSVGVVYQFGEIVDQKAEGLQFVWPWQELRRETIRVQRARFDNISGFSKETQDVFISATVNYSVAPEAVQTLFRTVGPNWFDTLVETRVNDFFKEETVKYNTVDIAPNREQIRTDVRDKLDRELSVFSINVNDLLIDNIDFSPEFKASIEQKQIAAQDALREQERVTQAEFEADQVVARAQGDADSIRIRAEGQAAANDLLDASLTPQVIQFLAVEKLAPNIQIALIPSGEGIILDPTALLSGITPGQATGTAP